jgi:hypothetical protein
MISHIEEGTWTEGVWEYGAEPKRYQLTGEWRKLHN